MRIILVILISIMLSGVVYADPKPPTFYNYSTGNFANKFVSASFGFFRQLNNAEEDAYQQALNHATVYANTGQTVSWYQGRASGTATPVFTWPINGGYCRRVHVQTFAFERERTQTATACFTGKTWRWVRSK